MRILQVNIRKSTKKKCSDPWPFSFMVGPQTFWTPLVLTKEKGTEMCLYTRIYLILFGIVSPLASCNFWPILFLSCPVLSCCIFLVSSGLIILVYYKRYPFQSPKGFLLGLLAMYVCILLDWMEWNGRNKSWILMSPVENKCFNNHLGGNEGTFYTVRKISWQLDFVFKNYILQGIQWACNPNPD